MSSNFTPFIPWICLLIAVLMLVFGLRSGRKQRLVEYLPTSKTTGVFIGLVELKGTAESGAPLTSFLAECKCVIYNFVVEEHWSRTVTETYTDSEGKTRTRTRHESGWTTVASGSDSSDFYLQDDCGIILVRPDGAKIEPAAVFSETCSRMDPLYYAKGPAFAVSDSDHRRRFVEYAIPIHAPIYVMGQSRERQDLVAPEIAADKACPLFLISTKSEEQIRKGFGMGFWFLCILGLLLSIGGFIFPAINGNAPSPQIWMVGISSGLGFILVWFLGWLWMVYNSLVELRERVRQGWAQVDVQLKRRHDLIPNLVECVKGLRDYESNLQKELAEFRTQATATAPGQPGPDPRACSSILIAIAEKYPQITAQESFLNLQKQLSDTEQRIALARSYFNEIATHYNLRLLIIPDRFVSSLANLQPQALMSADGFERTPIHVDFAT